MKRLSLLIVLPVSLIAIPALPAQETGITQSLVLVTMPTGEKLIEWYGEAGRSYFVQASKASSPLEKWSWAPIIESGNDEPISLEVEGTADRAFFRLKYTTQLPGLGETLETADFDGDGLSNIDEIAPPAQAQFSAGAFASQAQPNPGATDPLNPDTDGDGMGDGWENAHGLDSNDSSDAANPYPGSSLSNLEAFKAGVQANPNATLTNKDGDALEDLVDAAPRDPVIDWQKPAFEKFAAIEMPPDFLQPFATTVNFHFDCLELTDDFKLLVSGGGYNNSTLTFERIQGFWKPGDEFDAISGPNVTYDHTRPGATIWGEITRESVQPKGMAGSSILYRSEGNNIDYNFGGAILAQEGSEPVEFWEHTLGEQGPDCHHIDAIGGDRVGRAIVYLDGMYGEGHNALNQVWSMTRNSTSGNVSISKLCSTAGNSESHVNVTKGGWVSAYDKVYTPAEAELAAPAITGETIWSEDLPNGRLVVSRVASATKVYLLDAQQKFDQCEKGILKDQQVKAATQWGGFLNQANELWTRDRTDESQSNSWIPLQDWAGQKIADLVTAGWSLELSSSNPAGGMVLHLTKEDALPKIFTLLPVQFIDVGFSGDKYWEVWSDKGHPNLGGKIYEAPHWVDVNGDGKPDSRIVSEQNYPVAYSRDSVAKIGARIRIKGSEGMSLKLKATGPGSIVVPATVLQQNPAQSDTWKLSDTPSGKLPNTIKYYSAQEAGKEFKLSWQLSIDGGATWNKIHETDHTVYVTLGDPLEAGLTGPGRHFQETLFNIGCRNADGMTANSNNLVVNAIYNEFTDQKVSRVVPTQGTREPEVLTYWKDYSDQIPIGLMLSSDHRNGECGDWAQLLSRIIRNQGIAASSVVVKSPNYPAEGIMVKNWHFVVPGTSGNPAFPYIASQDAVPLTGIPAQGHGNGGIGKLFNQHIITLSDNYLYDPSYGSPAIPPLSNQPDYKKYEDSSFSGYHIRAGDKYHCRINEAGAQSASDVQAEVFQEN